MQLVSIQTSPNDRLLWSVDNRGSVFVRTGLSEEMPVGTDWELVPGTHVFVSLSRYDGQTMDPNVFMVSCMLVLYCVCVCVSCIPCTWNRVLVCTSGLVVSQLVLSLRTVWVRCVNGDLARRYGVSDRNPAGDYWKKIPGNANWFTGKTQFILSELDVCVRFCSICLALP